MITLISTIVVFGILVTIHEWGHFIVAKRQGIRVERFSVGFGPVLLRYTWHETEYALSAIPLGGYVKMAGDDPLNEETTKGEPWEFFSKTPWQRMKVVMAGPLMNYILAFAIFAVIFMIGSPTATSKIGGTLPDYPAAAAGLLEGDKVLSVNGQKVEYWLDLIKAIQDSEGAALNFEIERGEERINVDIAARGASADEQQAGQRLMIGIKPSDEMVTLQYGPIESLNMAAQKLWFISKMTYVSIGKMITGQMSLRSSMTGPIGIVVITGERAKMGLIYLLDLMGLLSAALALFNFLPIPVLDGGHFVIYLFELIRGKAVCFKLQDYIQRVGMALLLLLMVFVFYNDIVNFKLVDKAKSVFVQE